MNADVITYEVLADLFDVAIPSGAAIMRDLADEENRELIADALDSRNFWDGFDDDSVFREVDKLLRKVPTMAPDTKHNKTCWKTHAHCLAVRISALINDGGI